MKRFSVKSAKKDFGKLIAAARGKPVVNLLDEAGFGPLMDGIRLTSMDIGARGGFMSDLLPLARCVDMIGFEPDPDELERLKRAPQVTPWASMTYLHYALGRAERTMPFAHGDALYLRWPEHMPESSPDEIETKIRLGLLACAYEYIDHAVAALTTPAVAAYGRESFGIDFADSVSRLSKRLALKPAFIHRYRHIQG